ncbi:hypothetical protein [Streptomyces sp. NPDC048521]|uniref:hypothetical protein n=1 Tax=Streptomyces sp. NPDC048521 TaxID=3365566 RepID=UPI00371FBE2B
MRTWTLRALGAAAVLLVPWMVVLAVTLPDSTRVDNWRLAWLGLDALTAAGCATTALLGMRDDPRARLTASATASVAVLDAWFDITTAQAGSALVQALLCAVAEGALAVACVALALSGQLARPTGLLPCARTERPTHAQELSPPLAHPVHHLPITAPRARGLPEGHS